MTESVTIVATFSPAALAFLREQFAEAASSLAIDAESPVDLDLSLFRPVIDGGKMMVYLATEAP